MKETLELASRSSLALLIILGIMGFVLICMIVLIRYLKRYQGHDEYPIGFEEKFDEYLKRKGSSREIRKRSGLSQSPP